MRDMKDIRKKMQNSDHHKEDTYKKLDARKKKEDAELRIYHTDVPRQATRRPILTTQLNHAETSPMVARTSSPSSSHSDSVSSDRIILFMLFLLSSLTPM